MVMAISRPYCAMAGPSHVKITNRAAGSSVEMSSTVKVHRPVGIRPGIRRIELVGPSAIARGRAHDPLIARELERVAHGFCLRVPRHDDEADHRSAFGRQ